MKKLRGNVQMSMYTINVVCDDVCVAYAGVKYGSFYLAEHNISIKQLFWINLYAFEERVFGK